MNVGEGFSPTYMFFTNMHFSPTSFTNIRTVVIRFIGRGPLPKDIIRDEKSSHFQGQDIYAVILKVLRMT